MIRVVDWFAGVVVESLDELLGLKLRVCLCKMMFGSVMVGLVCFVEDCSLIWEVIEVLHRRNLNMILVLVQSNHIRLVIAFVVEMLILMF